jgi:hypothetical protein
MGMGIENTAENDPFYNPDLYNQMLGKRSARRTKFGQKNTSNCKIQTFETLVKTNYKNKKNVSVTVNLLSTSFS